MLCLRIAKPNKIKGIKKKKQKKQILNFVCNLHKVERNGITNIPKFI